MGTNSNYKQIKLLKAKNNMIFSNFIPVIIIFFALIILVAAYSFWDSYTKQTSSAAACPEISAKQAVLMDAKTGEILYEKNATSKAYPASTTKIMTALLTIETVEALNSDITQKVKIPAEAVGVEGSSIYLTPEEPVSIEDLLYGLMLRSGNDAATALACIIGGNQQNFVDLMNLKATEIGCTDTHFLNPSGLFDKNHYTTAADMALIAQAAMKNKTFKTIVSAEDWEASRAPDKYNYFYNKNKVVHQYDGGNGIKIGFTKASGRTLVASAERNGRQLICVVMGAPDWFNDSYKLMDYGFSVK
ncbi:D-alanyl-D-alanine carboxypeptidase family protein [Aminipila terrae]|uniref:D-alanyl-D-alanine carboxypeptidase n=1 Tax=Aminipila terrae TaxID=2697030 RepID=A0A6P1MEY4_9FIRM|nr:D-alanyl-D-alanine carboxypeptidase family protein [Aminipila terrae]QHI72467.1 D-alanyl-D-alanine carboxypeptidase [Aminipila terrae]